MNTSSTEALVASGAAADRADGMGLYGWLIGAWALDVTEFLDDGTQRRRAGEWHFGWVLEGRAIQDVWIVPPRSTRHDDASARLEYYGTMLRVYDPRNDAWHIAYTDPVVQACLTMIGRRQGDDIVQDGTDAAGNAVRWSFRDITPDSFVWHGEWSADSGANWHLRVQFHARRTAIRSPD